MKLIILWGIQAVFIQEIFIECLVCAQHSSSYKHSSYGAMMLAFKIQGTRIVMVKYGKL